MPVPLGSNNLNTFNVIGVMSGTSLDGLDIALCKFNFIDNRWKFKIENAISIKYQKETLTQLGKAYNCSGRDLTVIDYEYGRFIGRSVKSFIEQQIIQPDFIASHGHTIFHDPKSGYTLQIGKGSAIAAETGIPCVCDFRSTDVCKSGQGAPLVPIGDRLLFTDFDICLNLGGFSNISFEKKGERIAFDISPCNIALNYFAQKVGKDYDADGNIGKNGNINTNLLEELNELSFYKSNSPKSLGREWFEFSFLKIIEKFEISLPDILATLYEHIAFQIVETTNKLNGKSILITGGGAKNTHLIHLLKTKSNKTIIIPDELIIDYKEALIFAFLGVLYMIKQPSSLKSVTGANADSISGCLYY